MSTHAQRLERLERIYGVPGSDRPGLNFSVNPLLREKFSLAIVYGCARYPAIIVDYHVGGDAFHGRRARRFLCRIAREVLQSDEPQPSDFFVR